MQKHNLAAQAGQRHRPASRVEPDKVGETLTDCGTRRRTVGKRVIDIRPPEGRPLIRIENDAIVQRIEHTLLLCMRLTTLQCAVGCHLFTGLVGLPGPGASGCDRERPVITGILVVDKVLPCLLADVRDGIRICGR